MASKRIKYIDDLKTIAIFGVIVIHVCMFFGSNTINGISIYNYQEIVRFAVPVFLMISGALLLNREYEFGSFIKRRYVRIILPFILWQIIAVLIRFFLGQYDYLSEYNFLTQMWYFWLILGVYLAVPVINEFIKNKGLEGAEYFIIVVIFAAVFFQVLKTLGMYTYLDLGFFLGPVGFLVLGYYLANKEFDISPKMMILITLIIFIVTTLLKVYGFLRMFGITNFTLLNMEIGLNSNLNMGIMDIVHAVSVFLLVKALNESDIFSLKNKYLTKFSLSVSRASYGMYFAQDIIIFIFLGDFITSLSLTNLQAGILVIASCLGVFILSWLIVVLLSKIPHLKKFSGYA